MGADVRQYFARLVVPNRFRPYVNGKSEFREALGPDYRSALRLLPDAVVMLQQRIALAARTAESEGVAVTEGHHPLAPELIARRSYRERLELDEWFRQDPRYASAGYVDEFKVERLRDAMAGKLTDSELSELIGPRIEHFRRLGNTSDKLGTAEWRILARGLCAAEYEALARSVERDEGDFSGIPDHPMLKLSLVEPDEAPPVSLRGLFRDYLAAQNLLGKGREAERRWSLVIDDLRKFLKHDGARRITKRNLIDWRNAKLAGGLSPATVSCVYLAGIRTVLNWAFANDRLDGKNPAQNVRQPVPKKPRDREKGYTTAEAQRVLRASVAHQAFNTGNPATTESPTTIAARRWVPLLCAFSGARVAEITQLRKEDFRRLNGHLVMRLTPDAGTVKTGEFRDVPLHPQLIDLGFGAFLETAGAGPLFYAAHGARDPVASARSVATNVGKWLRAGVSTQRNLLRLSC